MSGKRENLIRFCDLENLADWHRLSPGPESDNSGIEICGKQIILPKIQRGLVWNARQIELLWDSVLRGFPIGTLVFLEMDGKYQLVDGQQRLYALSRGVASRSHEGNMKIFLDLEDICEGEDKYHRKFYPRVITRAHPWGFRRNNMEILPPNMRREFVELLKTRIRGKEIYRSGEYLIEDGAWDKSEPIDADVPILLSKLVGTYDKGIKRPENENDLKDIILNCLNEKKKDYEGLGLQSDKEREDWIKKKEESIRRVEDNVDAISSNIFDAINNIREIEIPFLSYSLNQDIDDNSHTKETRNHDIEELFFRINKGGTPLGGEDLMYSMLKSEAPQISDYVDKFTSQNQIMRPSRIVLLSSQFYSVKKPDKDSGNHNELDFPSTMTLKRFQRWIARTSNEKNEFENFTRGLLRVIRHSENTTGNHVGLFERVVDTLKKHVGPYIAACIANRSKDLFLLLLLKMMNDGSDEKRLIGAITAIHWFARSWQGRSRQRSIHEICKELSAKNVTDWRLGDFMTGSEPKLIPLSDDTKTKGAPDKFEWIHYQKELLLFAQYKRWKTRNVDTAIVSYDPTIPGRMQEVYTPWDYDHIMPDSKFPRRNCHRDAAKYKNTIGNLAAIPWRYNRELQNEFAKLSEADYANYAFIGDDEKMAWEGLQHLLYSTGDPVVLRKEKEDLVNTFVKCAERRIQEIYSTWSNEFDVPSLM